MNFLTTISVTYLGVIFGGLLLVTVGVLLGTFFSSLSLESPQQRRDEQMRVGTRNR